MATQHELEQAYGVILDHLRGNSSDEVEVQNFQGSEARVAKALQEMCWTSKAIRDRLEEVLAAKSEFPVSRRSGNKPGAVTQGPIHFSSLCPHHLLPFSGVVYLSYLPSAHVLGLSKLERTVETLSKRPVLQEQLTSDIADCLYKSTAGNRWPSIISEGSAVQLAATHSCMKCRGVQSSALTSTVELRGAFWEPHMEEKFYAAVTSIKTSGLL